MRLWQKPRRRRRRCFNPRNIFTVFFSIEENRSSKEIKVKLPTFRRFIENSQHTKAQIILLVL